MSSLVGIPRASSTLGSHVDKSSPIAAFKNRFGAVFLDGSNLKGSASLKMSASPLASYRETIFSRIII